MVLVEGTLGFAGGPSAVPPRVTVHIGTFSTTTYPGSRKWSVLIALDGPVFPQVRAFQHRLNVTVSPAGPLPLPDGWISARPKPLPAKER